MVDLASRLEVAAQRLHAALQVLRTPPPVHTDGSFGGLGRDGVLQRERHASSCHLDAQPRRTRAVLEGVRHRLAADLEQMVAEQGRRRIDVGLAARFDFDLARFVLASAQAR